MAFLVIVLLLLSYTEITSQYRSVALSRAAFSKSYEASPSLQMITTHIKMLGKSPISPEF